GIRPLRGIRRHSSIHARAGSDSRCGADASPPLLRGPMTRDRLRTRLREARVGFILLCLTPVAAAAQEGSIDGIVTAAATGAPLEGVAVTVSAGGGSEIGTLTDRN